MFSWCIKTGQLFSTFAPPPSEHELTSRVKHGPQQSVPEGMFDDSVKLVIWGHEHDCRLTPEKVEGKEYYISQPGSSVATSLAPGESIPK